MTNAELLLDHADFVRSIARALVLGPEDPEDVVQETMLKALTRPPRPGPGIRGWFATVARNALRQSRRSRLRATAREMAAARAEAVPGSDEIRAREATRQEVVDAALDLAEPYRSAVVLRYFENLPPRRIAERLGVPVETVKTRLKRAHRMLRKTLDARHGKDGRTWAIALLPIAGLGLSGPAVAGVAAVAAAVLLAGGLAFVLSGSGGDPETPPITPETPDLVADTGGNGGAGTGAADIAPGAEDPAREETSLLVPGAVLVLGRDGRPEKAHVLTTPEKLANMRHQVRLGETDSKGLLREKKFQRDPRSFIWAATRDSAAGPVPWSKDGVILRLGKACVLTGTIKDKDGRPLAGVILNEPHETTTDASGGFRFEGLFPETPYEVEAGILGYGRGPAAKETVVFSAGVTTKDLQIVLDAPPTGTVLLKLPAAVPGTRNKVRLRITEGPMATKRGFRFGAGSLIRLHLPRGAGEPAGVEAILVGYTPAVASFTLPAGPEVPEVVLTPGERIPTRGLVLDAEGNPVWDALVLACPSPGAVEGQPNSRRTDTDGTFSITGEMAGTHLVAMLKGQSVSPWVEVVGGTEDVVLRLDEGGVVTGRVLDGDTAVAGARVVLHLGMDEHFPQRFSTETAADGTYRFDGVPTGAVAMPLVETTYRARAAYDRDAVLEQLSRDEIFSEGVAARLSKPGEIFTRNLPARAKAGVECRFEVSLPAGVEPPRFLTVTQRTDTSGGYREVTRDEDFDPAQPELTRFLPVGKNRVVVRAGRLFSDPFTLEVTEAGPAVSALLTLKQAPRVMARLVDEQGGARAIRDAEIDVWIWHGSGGSGVGKVMTDSEGIAEITDLLAEYSAGDAEGRSLRFVIRAPGLYTGTCREPNFELDGTDYLARITAAGSGTVTIDLPVTGAREIEVPVTDPDGNPLPGVPVRGHPESAFQNANMTSDRNGMIRFRILEIGGGWSGPYLEARSPYVGRLGLDDNRGDDARRLIVDPTRSIRLRLVDEGGEPVASSPVEVEYYRGWVESAWPHSVELMTDAAGCVEVAVPTRSEQVKVAVPGFLTKDVDLESGKSKYLLTLDTVRRLVVTVEPGEGFPGGRVHVGCRFPGEKNEESSESIETDRGVWEAEFDVPGRKILIDARTNDGLWTGSAEHDGSGGEARVLLTARPLFPATFRVVEGDGQPVVGIRVEIEVREFGLWLERVLFTDERGEVALPLPEGTYEDIDVQLTGRRLEEEPDEVVVPSPQPVLLKTVFVYRQVIILDFSKTDVEPDTGKARVRFRDGVGRRAGHSGGSSMSSGKKLSLNYEMPYERCMIEVEYEGQIFTLPYEGRAVEPPVFEIR